MLALWLTIFSVFPTNFPFSIEDDGGNRPERYPDPRSQRYHARDSDVCLKEHTNFAPPGLAAVDAAREKGRLADLSAGAERTQTNRVGLEGPLLVG
jgi:hypothetical protein